MLLSALTAQLGAVSIDGPTDRPIDRVIYDSREAGPADLFVAIRGERVDARRFVPTLQVAAVIADGPVVARDGVTVIQVDNARLALARASAALWAHPAEDLPVVGITGTNGKTTLTWMLEAIVSASGAHSGVIGTTGHRIAGVSSPASHTTPEAPILQALLREMIEADCLAALMEVSSIGIVMHRVDAIPFRVAVFTNFSRDHLNFHSDMEDYLDAKARLFHTLLASDGIAILNVDDPATTQIDPGPRETRTYGLRAEAQYRGVALQPTVKGTQFQIMMPDAELSLFLPLIGRHNVLNALGACATARAIGIAPEHITQGLEGLSTIPGRLEPVENAAGITVLVDFAHTPDAMRAVLSSLRPLTRGRILTVFGCGGDRDPGKRPQMGEAAADGSDWVFVTSDNPRHEAPMAIIEAIVKGIAGPHTIEPDRGAAISAAIHSAKPGDIVLIAGKGHETTQTKGDVTVPFDDRIVAARVLRGMT
jgi:UDP-N-acetylmuramyl-tripeptide synthetase